MSLFHSLVALCLFVLSTLCAAQPVVYTALPNDMPVLGSLAANSTAYFTFQSAAVPYQQTALISVSASSGSPTLYVSLTDPVPSAGSFQYQASWLTGGVVSVTVQPPYTVYIAVQASSTSRCNFTVLVSAYNTTAQQTTPIPLSSAQALASAIAGGEYRYFTYAVAAGTALTTIALTETYGQSWLLLNSPNATQLPTLSSYQYASSSATFPLVALLQPAAGVWSVGVWSSQSSAFSIIAADSTDTQPMEQGVTYPGYVPQQVHAYYSLYIDPLLLTSGNSVNLDLTLQSLSGDADLFCSQHNSKPQNYGDSDWFSAATSQVDRIFLSAAQLSAGSLYCSVLGWFTSTYIFSASYGAAITLTPGETVVTQTLAAGSQLYSMVFPASAVLVTLSVVSEVGTTEIHVGGAGAQPTSNNYVSWEFADTSHLQQLRSSFLCGELVPGSSPPLCQMQVLVVTDSVSEYAITAYTAGELVQLISGQSMEGELSSVSPVSYFTFDMPDNLSNATLSITATNGASDLLLSVGQESWRTIDVLWTASQQSGSDVLVFQLDYTQTLPWQRNRIQGEYITAVSSATGEAATFSIVYSVTNGSIFSESIVLLQDGVPQDGIVSTGAYNFYYFTPPAIGWPYTVIISVIWTSGFGKIRTLSTDGPHVGPTALDNVASITNPIIITPDSYAYTICNANLSSTCGYSISVQGGEQSQYSITAASTGWVRRLYTNWPVTSLVMEVGGADYWSTSVTILSTAVNAQLTIGVSVLSGSVTILASNSTPSPNAATAQHTLANVSSTAVLAVPMLVATIDAVVYTTVICTSSDGTLCQYTVQAQKYDENPKNARLYGRQATVDLLLPAGGIQWATFLLDTYVSLAYLVMQVDVSLGTPSLYATCLAIQPSQAVLPNETYNTWQAVTAPLLIELFDFNATAASCLYLSIGVRASGGQAAMVVVELVIAGAMTEFDKSIGSMYGVTTPAYPVSYYQYTQTSYDPATVLYFSLSEPYTAGCSINQLRLTLSDTTPYPNASNPATYNLSRTAVTLSNGITDLTVALTNYTKPPGILHAGNYYVAVSSMSNATCTFWLVGNTYRQTVLTAGKGVWRGASQDTSAHFTFAPVPYNTSTSLALRLYPDKGVLLLYVGVNSAPTPFDPSTYLLSAMFDSASANGSWNQAVIYIPASACSSATLVGQSCAVVGMMATTVWYENVDITPMTSAANVWLLENPASTSANRTTATATYQFSLGSSHQLVTLTINTSSLLAVWCSYQYVTPTAQFSEWQWEVDVADDGSSASSQLNITWGAANNSSLSQMTNPSTLLAALPTVCYCTVKSAVYNTSYSIAYSTTLLAPSGTPSSSSSSSTFLSSSSTASSAVTAFSSFPASSLPLSSSSSSWSSTPAVDTSSGLSREAQTAAVVVPVLFVLLLLAALLAMWLLRRRGDRSGLCCFGDLSDKESPGGSSTRHRLDEADNSEMSVMELSNRMPRNGQLMSQQWRSD